MTEFESTLAAALRAEAEEITMSVDHDRSVGELEKRLDGADRSRRRMHWVAAAAVVAVIAGGVLLASQLGDKTAEAPPGGPSPSASTSPVVYTSNVFAHPFRATLPPWFTSPEYPTDSNDHQVVWEQNTCSLPDNPCSNGTDLKLRFVAPSAFYSDADATQPTALTSYDAFLAHLDSMKAAGVIVESESTPITVGRHPATRVTFTASTSVPGLLACPDTLVAATSCWGVTQGQVLRLVAVDTGEAPVLIWMRGNPDNPAWSGAATQFDQMLASLEFLPATSASP